MSADDNLRDALMKAIKDEIRDQGHLFEWDENEPEADTLSMSSGAVVDLTAVGERLVQVIKDWTVPGPPVEGFTPDAESIRMRKSLDALNAACPVRDVYGNIIS